MSDTTAAHGRAALPATRNRVRRPRALYGALRASITSGRALKRQRPAPRGACESCHAPRGAHERRTGRGLPGGYRGALGTLERLPWWLGASVTGDCQRAHARGLWRWPMRDTSARRRSAARSGSWQYLKFVSCIPIPEPRHLKPGSGVSAPGPRWESRLRSHSLAPLILHNAMATSVYPKIAPGYNAMATLVLPKNPTPRHPRFCHLDTAPANRRHLAVETLKKLGLPDCRHPRRRANVAGLRVANGVAVAG